MIEYGSEIWNYYGREIFEIGRVQLKFIKMLLGVRVKQSTATCAIRAEMYR